MAPVLYRPPRVYRPDLTMKVVFAISGCILIAFGSLFSYLFGRILALNVIGNDGALPAGSGNRLAWELLAGGAGVVVLLCVIAGITQLLKLAKFAVILNADSIRFQSPFGSTSLAFDQILCKRCHVTAGRFGYTYTVLIPKDAKRRNLTISSDFVFDEAYARWLASLPEASIIPATQTR